MFLIGVDIGTSSTKGVLVDQSGNRCIASCCPWWTGHILRGPNRMRTSFAGEFAAVARALMLTCPMGRVVGVGGGTCPTPAPVSHREGASARNPLQHDRRALSNLAIKSLVGEKEIASAVAMPCPRSVLVKILWLKRHEPEIMSVRNGLGTHYVVWRLTGEAAGITR